MMSDNTFKWKDGSKNWAICMQDGGVFTQYPTRAAARAAARHRSQFDNCAYCVFKRKGATVEWEHVETHDFNKALRVAFAAMQ